MQRFQDYCAGAGSAFEGGARETSDSAVIMLIGLTIIFRALVAAGILSVNL